MAITKVTTGGITDATIATADIADNAVTAGKLASGVQTTINNNADNRVITGSGTANTLEGEANLTFSSNTLTVHEASLKGNQLLFNTSGTAYIDHSTTGQDIQYRTSVSSSQDTTGPTIKSNGRLGVGTTSPQLGVHFYHASDNGILLLESGDANCRLDLKDNGGQASIQAISDALTFNTSSSVTERVRIDSSGRVMIGTTTEGNGDGDDLTIATSGRTGITIRSADDDYGNIFFSDGTSGASEYVGKVQYYHADNSMRFATNANDRLTIDSSGNVGIGTTSPITKLEIENGSDLDNILVVRGADDTTEYAGIGVTGGNAIFTAGGVGSTSAGMVFRTAASGTETERVRIDAAGNFFFAEMVDLNASSSNKGINIENQANYGRMNIHANGSAGNSLGISFYNDGTNVGTVYYNTSSTTYNTSSDYRLKENVTAISDGITRLKTLKPSRFNFKVDKDKTVDGFLAHEVTPVVPEAITGTKDEVDSDNKPIYQGIDHSKLVPLLTAALQELITRVEKLEAA